MLLYGKFAPSFWKRIVTEDPQVAENEVKDAVARLGGEVSHFFFALDEFDFYAVLETPSTSEVDVLRHSLMSRGAFLRLHGEIMTTYGELFDRFQERQKV